MINDVTTKAPTKFLAKLQKNATFERSSNNTKSVKHNSTVYNMKSKSVSVCVCRCCGLVSSYPVDSMKFECNNCHTINHNGELPSRHLQEQSDLEPLSLLKLQQLIQSCSARAKLAVPPNDGHQIRQAFEPLSSMLYRSFNSQACLNKSFLLNTNQKNLHYSTSNLNNVEIKKFFQLLCQLPTKMPLFNALTGAIDSLKHCYSWNLLDADKLLYILICLEIPLIPSALNALHSNSTPKSMAEVPGIKKSLYEIYSRSLGLLARYPTPSVKCYICSWYSKYPRVEYIRMVETVNLFITNQLRTYYISAQKRQPMNKRNSVNYETSRNNSQSKNEVELNGSTGSSQNLDKSLKKITIGQYGNDWLLESASLVLNILVKASQFYHPSIPVSNFYNLMVDFIDVKVDFDSWQTHANLSKNSQASNSKSISSSTPDIQTVIQYIHGSQKYGNYSYIDSASFFVCQYPFLISLGAKISILEYEAKRKMTRKVEEAFINSLDQKMVIDMYFWIKIRRNYIVQDSLLCIQKNANNLQKSLRVKFIGEPGIDVGGLKKEWFLILTRDLFNPQAEVFVNVEESNYLWFNLKPTEKLDVYYLFGAVLGLAIYNSTILDLKFPPALYKLLLGRKLSFDDFQEIYPEVARNLLLLKTYDKELLSTLELTFEIDFKDAFNNVYTKELIPGGSKIKVEHHNLSKYIEMYYKFHIEEGIKMQVKQFLNGFIKVLGGNAISLFEPEEIELLLCGSDDKKLDLEVLKSVTVYNGWESREVAINSKLIKWFWQYMDSQPFTLHCKFLMFISGSDRVPATGLQNLAFKITKLSSEKDRKKLPVAHTCFNELVLYPYKSKEELCKKLDMAIRESSGFGLK